MKLSLGFSPCPNDTFIFDALIHRKIDTKGYEFDLHLADVEELNQKAKTNQLDITKLSYHALAKLILHYDLLSSGSALGNHCGPLLVTKRYSDLEDLEGATVALPGKQTTAHFLFNFYNKQKVYKQFLLFSDIEDAVITNQADAGVIIHENRFTYHDRGMQLIQDLGDYWENETGYPIPLGGIVMKKNLDLKVKQDINSLIRESIHYAFNNKSVLPAFVKQNAQEMSEDVMRKHIDLYVNKYSLNLGETGKSAVEFMMSQITRNDLTIIE